MSAPLPMSDFVQGGEVTEDDLRVAEAIRDDLFRTWFDETLPAGKGNKSLVPVADYIDELRRGRWPGTDSGWSTADCAQNPKTQIRVAQLCERHIAEKRGGTWHAIACSYPTERRDMFGGRSGVSEHDYASVKLLCTDGAEQGHVAWIRYHRWKDGSFDIVGTDIVQESIDRNREAYRKLREGSPVLASHDFLVRYGDVLDTPQLMSDQWSKATVYVIENEADAEEGYPLRHRGDATGQSDLISLEAQVGKSLGTEETRVLVLPASDEVALSGGGSTETFGLREAQELMGTGCYSVDGSASMAVAYRQETLQSPKHCLSERFQSEKEAERAMGESLSLGSPVDVTVPDEIKGGKPFSWEVLSWSANPEFRMNDDVMLVRYGSPEDVSGVVALGWEGVTHDCWEMLGLPVSEIFHGNRREELGTGRSLYLHDVPSGVTAQWYSETDESNDSQDSTECMVYVPGASVSDDDLLMEIAKGTSLR